MLRPASCGLVQYDSSGRAYAWKPINADGGNGRRPKGNVALGAAERRVENDEAEWITGFHISLPAY